MAHTTDAHRASYLKELAKCIREFQRLQNLSSNNGYRPYLINMRNEYAEINAQMTIPSNNQP